jgi:methionyl-tRNA formyltransferase
MMDQLKVVVFAYNFPHRKTQDFLHRLYVEQIPVVAVLAADPVQLSIPPSAVRTKPRYGALVHPRKIAEAYAWPYQVVDHKSARCLELIGEYKPDVGVIAGARILGKEMIEKVPRGIINFHPAILPGGRGLDALQWAVVENRPIGVTAHLIDSRVDAGRLILAREITLHEDDSLMDLSIRLHDLQVEMLPEVMKLVSENREFPALESAPLHRKMPAELELQVPEIFRRRVQARRADTPVSAPLDFRNSTSEVRPVASA